MKRMEEASTSALWRMRSALMDSLDRISSPRSSLETRSLAFESIEKHLAGALSPREEGGEGLDHFLALQLTFECNVPLRLLSWISTATAQLEGLTRSSADEHHNLEAFLIAQQLTQALSLIQGITLSHTPCKDYLGRRYPLEVLLDLLLVSRHLSSPSADKDRGKDAKSDQSTPTPNPPPPSHRKPVNPIAEPLTSIVLDTLLCILVDSSPALRAFEEAHGPHAVVKLLKRAGTPREVRMKCLEFLYFYLLDETTPTTTVATTPSGSQHTPTDTEWTPPNSSGGLSPVPSTANPACPPGLSPGAASSRHDREQQQSQPVQRSPTPLPSPLPSHPPPTAPATPLRPSKTYLGIGPAPRRPGPSSVYGSSTYAHSSLSDSAPSSREASGVTALATAGGSRSTSGSSAVSFSSTESVASGSASARSTPPSSVGSSPEKGAGQRVGLMRRGSREFGVQRGASGIAREREREGLRRVGSGIIAADEEQEVSQSKSRVGAGASAVPATPARTNRLGSGAPLKERGSFRFPAPLQPRMVMLKKEVEYEPVSPLKKTSSSSEVPVPVPLPATPASRHDRERERRTGGANATPASAVRHSKSKSMSNVLSSAGERTPSGLGESVMRQASASEAHHRRGGETRDVVTPSRERERGKDNNVLGRTPGRPRPVGSAATVPLIVSPSTSSSEGGSSVVTVTNSDPRKQAGEGGVRRKTTEEKKELLGTMLGNVDVLVEGVRKAGVWGLG